MAAREKADDSAPRMGYLDIVEYAHKYEQLDRQNVPLWISNFRPSIVKILSGFSHIEVVFDLFITSDETNNAEICFSKFNNAFGPGKGKQKR